MTASLLDITDVDRLVYAAQLAELLGEFERVVELMDRAIAIDDADPRLYRLRGHRHISLRHLEQARADFLRAAELIEDTADEHEFYPEDTIADIYSLVIGDDTQQFPQHAPVNDETNARYATMYKTTLHGAIWYHLGLSHYLLGDFDQAYAAFTVAAEKAVENDLRLAALDWRFMCLRRLGRFEEAAELLVGIETENVESNEVFYLRRLRMYTGKITPEELLEASGEGEAEAHAALATQGYGVANWYLTAGEHDRAREILARVVEEGFSYAFGRIAAERDLATILAPEGA